MAICGKGGVGKTSISALIVKILMKKNVGKILAIDADPAVGLATALGITVKKTVDDIRTKLIDQVKDGDTNKEEMLSLIDYEIFDAIAQKDNLGFLAIGRPETEGCYCRINNFLKDVIKSTAYHFDYVVIDGEAGIEQVNRRVMEDVDHLLLISDASAKGLNVINEIKSVADKAVKYDRVMLLLNKLRSQEEADKVSVRSNVELAGWLPEDDMIRDYDIEGISILELKTSPALSAIEKALDKTGFVAATNS